ncbi:MAG: hypothetical protein HWQ36_00910 [Nostoc sp. NMS2]|nr:hypothetical protein [Nostoc sp. NMS2]MBN3989138.1 hypothetical protein [Nostoc sp. NMS2]
MNVFNIFFTHIQAILSTLAIAIATCCNHASLIGTATDNQRFAGCS